MSLLKNIFKIIGTYLRFLSDCIKFCRMSVEIDVLFQFEYLTLNANKKTIHRSNGIFYTMIFRIILFKIFTSETIAKAILVIRLLEMLSLKQFFFPVFRYYEIPCNYLFIWCFIFSRIFLNIVFKVSFTAQSYILSELYINADPFLFARIFLGTL